jgi:hypothetical protein
MHVLMAQQVGLSTLFLSATPARLGSRQVQHGFMACNKFPVIHPKKKESVIGSEFTTRRQKGQRGQAATCKCDGTSKTAIVLFEGACAHDLASLKCDFPAYP